MNKSNVQSDPPITDSAAQKDAIAPVSLRPIILKSIQSNLDMFSCILFHGRRALIQKSVQIPEKIGSS
jgi:hypothetical protein